MGEATVPLAPPLCSCKQADRQLQNAYDEMMSDLDRTAPKYHYDVAYEHAIVARNFCEMICKECGVHLGLPGNFLKPCATCESHKR